MDGERGRVRGDGWGERWRKMEGERERGGGKVRDIHVGGRETGGREVERER